MLASVYVCRPWIDMIAEHAGANGPTRGLPSSSALGIRRGLVLDNGNVGFQLIGGHGGGIYLVRRVGPLALGPARVWYNTNWERPLPGEWYLVFED